MPIFNIKDEETGMQISISGDNAPQEADIPQLFSAARQNAQKQLSEGSYKKDAEFQKRSKSDQQESIKKLSASALGMSADDIDIHSGSSFKERLVLGNLPDEPSRLQYMEKKYGNENVEMLDVGGTPKMVRLVIVRLPFPTTLSKVTSKLFTVKVDSLTKDRVFTTPAFSLFIKYIFYSNSSSLGGVGIISGFAA